MLKLATMALTECQALCWELSICCVWVPWLLFTCSHEEMRGVSTFRTQQNPAIWPQVPCQVLILEWWPHGVGCPSGVDTHEMEMQEGRNKNFILNSHCTWMLILNHRHISRWQKGTLFFLSYEVKANRPTKVTYVNQGRSGQAATARGPPRGFLPAGGQRHESCWWGRLLQLLPSLPSLLCLPSPSLNCILFPFPLPCSFLSLGLMLIKPHWGTKP